MPGKRWRWRGKIRGWGSWSHGRIMRTFKCSVIVRVYVWPRPFLRLWTGWEFSVKWDTCQMFQQLIDFRDPLFRRLPKFKANKALQLFGEVIMPWCIGTWEWWFFKWQSLIKLNTLICRMMSASTKELTIGGASWHVPVWPWESLPDWPTLWI